MGGGGGRWKLKLELFLTEPLHLLLRIYYSARKSSKEETDVTKAERNPPTSGPPWLCATVPSGHHQGQGLPRPSAASLSAASPLRGHQVPGTAAGPPPRAAGTGAGGHRDAEAGELRAGPAELHTCQSRSSGLPSPRGTSAGFGPGRVWAGLVARRGQRGPPQETPEGGAPCAGPRGNRWPPALVSLPPPPKVLKGPSEGPAPSPLHPAPPPRGEGAETYPRWLARAGPPWGRTDSAGPAPALRRRLRLPEGARGPARCQGAADGLRGSVRGGAGGSGGGGPAALAVGRPGSSRGGAGSREPQRGHRGTHSYGPRVSESSRVAGVAAAAAAATAATVATFAGVGNRGVSR